MSTATDNVLAKSFARERMRIWKPVLSKHETLGDLLRTANRRYLAENNALEQLALTPPSQERYAKICALLKQAYARACAENDLTITFSDFADKAFCLLGESPKGPTAESPEALLFTAEEIAIYNAILAPTLATINLWARHVIYLELPTERKSPPPITFRKTDFADRYLWNSNCYSLMRVFYSNRKNLQDLSSRVDSLIPILGEDELHREFESQKLVDIINEKTIEQSARINAEFIRLACTNPSVDLDDTALDNFFKQIPQQNVAQTQELRNTLDAIKNEVERARDVIAAGGKLSDEDIAGCQEAQDFLTQINELLGLSEAPSTNNTFADEVVAKIREQPLDARIVDVDQSAGKSLRATLQDPGGRPTKTHGGAKVMTQAEMAIAFGEPCNAEMVANWEARAAGKKRGANPPDAEYKGEKIVYTAELRLNPTPDNKNRLSALISEFQGRHRIKDYIGKKSLHMRSSETLARASGQVDEAIREKSRLKNKP